MLKNFLYLIIIVFSFSSCGYGQGDMKQITTKELKEKLNSGDTTFVVLDVRTPEELTGEMPKIESAIAIPLQELNERYNELDKYKNKEIYVICRSGRRSAAAVNTLKPKGYNVINVSGGMLSYTQEK